MAHEFILIYNNYEDISYSHHNYCFSLPSIAKGEIDYVKSANNVTLIGSNTNIGSIISAGAMKRGMIIAIANSKKAPLIYSLEQYTSNNKQQYALKVWVSPNKKCPLYLIQW